jgi:hypothetical protein
MLNYSNHYERPGTYRRGKVLHLGLRLVAITQPSFVGKPGTNTLVYYEDS